MYQNTNKESSLPKKNQDASVSKPASVPFWVPLPRPQTSTKATSSLPFWVPLPKGASTTPPQEVSVNYSATEEATPQENAISPSEEVLPVKAVEGSQNSLEKSAEIARQIREMVKLPFNLPPFKGFPAEEQDYTTPPQEGSTFFGPPIIRKQYDALISSVQELLPPSIPPIQDPMEGRLSSPSSPLQQWEASHPSQKSKRKSSFNSKTTLPVKSGEFVHPKLCPCPQCAPSAQAKGSANSACTCEQCHFESEERDLFPYLPQHLAQYLQEQHQFLKARHYPAYEVEQHKEEEMNYLRPYLPPSLLNRLESEHQQMKNGASKKGGTCSSCKVNSPATSSQFSNTSSQANISPTKARSFKKQSPQKASPSTKNGQLAVWKPKNEHLPTPFREQRRDSVPTRKRDLPKPDGFRPHPGPQPEPGDPGPGPGGTPGPGTPYDTTVSYCKSYDGIGECTENASATNPIIRSAVDPSLLELALCVGQSHLFRLFITLTNGNLQTTMVCTDPYALLYQIDEVQSITIQYILWECEGAIPAKKYGKTYEALFPKVGYYVIRAYVYLTRPEFCFSGKQELVAKPFIVVVNGVQSIRSNNGFTDGQNLGYGEKEIVELEALFLVPGIVDKEEMRWELSPPESGELLYSIGKILNRFFPAEDYRGEILIKAKLCSTDPGAEFHLKVIGDLWIEADKEILCKDSDEVVNLQAYTNSENVGGGDILWGVNPEEAGSLASGTGFTNQFIPNPEYVSESYQDIKITAQLFDQNDSVKITVVSFELYSKGIRKDKLSNESTGINEEENGPWDSGMNGRLFVDTDEEWKGKCLDPNMFDKQRVLFEVQVSPIDIPADIVQTLQIQWKLYDPDDPSSSEYIDFVPSYVPSEDPMDKILIPDSENIGGDNTGIPYEREKESKKFWFTGDMIEGTAVEYNPFVENGLIAEAKSQLLPENEILNSLVYFNFSDHGGDNFVIKVELLQNEIPFGCFIETGTLTVWRKRCVEIMAMLKDDKKPSAGNYYPWEDPSNGPSGIRNALANAYSEAYIDFYVRNADKKTERGFYPLRLPNEKLDGIYNGEVYGIEADLKIYANEYIESWYTPGETAKPIDTIKIIGVDSLTFPRINALGEIQKEGKDAIYGYNPEYTPYLFIPKQPKNSSYASSIVHEMGHCLSHSYKVTDSNDFIWYSSDMHGYLTGSARRKKTHTSDCAFMGTEGREVEKKNSEYICERHIRLLRNSIKRVWWNIELRSFPPTDTELREVIMLLPKKERDKIFD